jgi:tetraacyldisaccharide-1-P 4'-kinase
MIVTTSKDVVRLPAQTASGVPVVEVPLRISIESAFQPWLRERLARARAA